MDFGLKKHKKNKLTEYFHTVTVYLTGNLHNADKIVVTMSESLTKKNVSTPPKKDDNYFIEKYKIKPVCVKLKKISREEIEKLTKGSTVKYIVYSL